MEEHTILYPSAPNTLFIRCLGTQNPLQNHLQKGPIGAEGINHMNQLMSWHVLLIEVMVSIQLKNYESSPEKVL